MRSKQLKVSSVRMTTTLSEEQVAEYKEAFTLFDLGYNTCLAIFLPFLAKFLPFCGLFDELSRVL